MQLAIRHETVYRYTTPLAYTIQQLRLSPRVEPQQHVLSWQIETLGRRHAFDDAFGNVGHILTITEQHHEVRIVAHGVIAVSTLDQGRLRTQDAVNPLVFTVPTALTEVNEAVRDFAQRHVRPARGGAQFLQLAEAIRDAIRYQSGATAVTTTATAALQLGQGVCQDHAHLFLACCRVHDIPARYVSGYIHPGDTSHAESHAWVDVWVEEKDFSGWISIDVTHARYIDDAYCRLAIGRDYDSAAPVRGVRHGGGEESLSVRVSVETR